MLVEVRSKKGYHLFSLTLKIQAMRQNIQVIDMGKLSPVRVHGQDQQSACWS